MLEKRLHELSLRMMRQFHIREAEKQCEAREGKKEHVVSSEVAPRQNPHLE